MRSRLRRLRHAETKALVGGGVCVCRRTLQSVQSHLSRRNAVDSLRRFLAEVYTSKAVELLLSCSRTGTPRSRAPFAERERDADRKGSTVTPTVFYSFHLETRGVVVSCVAGKRTFAPPPVLAQKPTRARGHKRTRKSG